MATAETTQQLLSDATFELNPKGKATREAVQRLLHDPQVQRDVQLHRSNGVTWRDETQLLNGSLNGQEFQIRLDAETIRELNKEGVYIGARANPEIRPLQNPPAESYYAHYTGEQFLQESSGMPMYAIEARFLAEIAHKEGKQFSFDPIGNDRIAISYDGGARHIYETRGSDIAELRRMKQDYPGTVHEGSDVNHPQPSRPPATPAQPATTSEIQFGTEHVAYLAVQQTEAYQNGEKAAYGLEDAKALANLADKANTKIGIADVDGKYITFGEGRNDEIPITPEAMEFLRNSPHVQLTKSRMSQVDFQHAGAVADAFERGTAPPAPKAPKTLLEQIEVYEPEPARNAAPETPAPTHAVSPQMMEQVLSQAKEQNIKIHAEEVARPAPGYHTVKMHMEPQNGPATQPQLLTMINQVFSMLTDYIGQQNERQQEQPQQTQPVAPDATTGGSSETETAVEKTHEERVVDYLTQNPAAAKQTTMAIGEPSPNGTYPVSMTLGDQTQQLALTEEQIDQLSGLGVTAVEAQPQQATAAELAAARDAAFAEAEPLAPTSGFATPASFSSELQGAPSLQHGLGKGFGDAVSVGDIEIAPHEPEVPAAPAFSGQASDLRANIMDTVKQGDSDIRVAIDKAIGGNDGKFDDKDLNKLQTASLDQLKEIIGSLGKSGVSTATSVSTEAALSAAPSASPVQKQIDSIQLV